MQAASTATTQTQAHRSHGVGSNPAEGDLQQVPSGLMGEILSNLTCGEQAVAISAAPASLRDRVASHRPSVEQLEEALKSAAREGRYDEVVALLNEYQEANIPEQTKYTNICLALDEAVKAGHLSIVRHILSNVQLRPAELNGSFILAVLHNQPQIFRVVASYVNFSAISQFARKHFFQVRNTPERHEMFQAVTEVIGPYFTDAEFESAAGRPRRLSDSALPVVNEPAGCLV